MLVTGSYLGFLGSVQHQHAQPLFLTAWVPVTMLHSRPQLSACVLFIPNTLRKFLWVEEYVSMKGLFKDSLL